MYKSWLQMSLIMCCLCLVALGAPHPIKVVEEDPELTAGYFQGDIELDNDYRNGIIAESEHWPNATVPYKIDPEFAEPFVAHIKLAMTRIELVSCIRFVPAEEDAEDYVFILNSTFGCSSQLGYQPGKRTLKLIPLSLDSGCFRLGTIQHELLHTLGFRHQQSSSNRDEYVLIVEENIKEGRETSFQKSEPGVLGDFGQEYDYGSVLHYGPLAFSNNGKPTIVALQKEGQSQMGQRLQMSKADINRLNIMYKCPLQM